jgi:hypothetical protein
MAFDYYKGYTIIVERERDCDDWYIQVTGPDGTYSYDGWWNGSAYRSEDDAIAEAKSGAMIDEYAQRHGRGEGK